MSRLPEQLSTKTGEAQIDAAGVEAAGPGFDPTHRVALLKEQFPQIAAVLAGVIPVIRATRPVQVTSVGLRVIRWG